MAEITGWYYLHENKELIYKNYSDAIADIRESDLCLAAWPINPEDRSMAWDVLVESLSLGANPERIKELAEKWGADDADAEHYAEYINVSLGRDGDQLTAHRKDFVNLHESPCGFGSTYLEALADLCKKLGYVGGKLGWHTSFRKLCDTEKTHKIAEPEPWPNRS